MNEIQKFDFNGNAVRAMSIDGQPWFVGKDVAAVLGYSNARDTLAKHVDAEDKGVANCDTLGGKQNVTIINESGLYSLILSSKLPTAKQFKHWVTAEVLPAIRQHGAYLTDKKAYDIVHNPDSLADWNLPTQKAMDMGLFEIKETVISSATKSPIISRTAKVTGYGQQYFVNLFLKER